MPCSRQRLNSWHRNGNRMSTFAFSDHVGSGSERRCLLGSESTSFSTSAGVIGRNEQLVGHSVKNGGSAPAVAVRTPVTLSSRWRCMSEASMSGGGGRPRPNSSSKDRHKRHGCDWSVSTRSVQYVCQSYRTRVLDLDSSRTRVRFLENLDLKGEDLELGL